jgi:hypothetical protein
MKDCIPGRRQEDRYDVNWGIYHDRERPFMMGIRNAKTIKGNSTAARVKRSTVVLSKVRGRQGR